jgi:hypothetical protein
MKGMPIAEFAKDKDGQVRDIIMIVDEAILNECGEPRQMVWFADVTTETRPMMISNWTVPEASGNFCDRGGRFGTALGVALVEHPARVALVAHGPDQTRVPEPGEVHRDVVLLLAERGRHLADAHRAVGEHPHDRRAGAIAEKRGGGNGVADVRRRQVQPGFRRKGGADGCRSIAASLCRDLGRLSGTGHGGGNRCAGSGRGSGAGSRGSVGHLSRNCVSPG